MSQQPEKSDGVKFDDAIKQAVDSISEENKRLKTLNIIVCGKTGVGKSTLINSIFDFDEAETGAGKPITKYVSAYWKAGVPLIVYDTPGLELDEEFQKKVEDDIDSLIKAGVESKDINGSIHCVLYCISAAGTKIEDTEIEWLKKLTEAGGVTKVPVIVVLTKCVMDDDAIDKMHEVIEQENLNIVGIVDVLAKDMVMTRRAGDVMVPSFGLDELVQLMGRSLPEEIKDTFWSVQQASLSEKQKKSHIAVAAAATSAAAIGAIPIPFSDCAALVPTQMAMLGTISVIFGMKLSKSLLADFIASTVGAGGAAVLGINTVASILKLIPGAGPIAGGIVSGATAGVLTTALGEAYIAIMTKLYKGEINMDDITSEKGKAMISDIFKEELKNPKKYKEQ